MHCDTTGVGTYLSWVPVVGGTVGVFAGGIISDGLARRLGSRSRIIVLVTCCVSNNVSFYLELYNWYDGCQ